MRRCLALFSIVVFFILVARVSAEPLLENILIQPENVWFGDSITISLDCYDPTNNVNQVYGRIVDPIVSDYLSFNYQGDNNYVLTLSSLYSDPSKSPQYTLNIDCQNDINQSSTTSVSFNISQIQASIISVTNPAYLGDIAEMDISIIKDDLPLYSDGIDFDLKVGGQTWPKISFYDSEKERWVIKFNVPSVLGVYDLDLGINLNLNSYSQKNIDLSSSMEVKNLYEFKILDTDKIEIQPNDFLTVSLAEYERGNRVVLSKDYLSFQIGSYVITSDRVTLSSAGNHFDANISMPNLSPGSYDLKITSNYADYPITLTRTIGYVIPVSGKFLDTNGKGINAEIKFYINNIEKKKFSTDSSGSYSGFIVPGNYTIQTTFPQSTLYLYGASITSFSDPIKYYSLDGDAEGIKSAALFSYEVAIPFANAKVVMSYDEKKVTSEENVVVYKCSSFNPSNKACNSNWTEQTFTIDKLSNYVTIETNSFSAYVIGTKKSLSLDFSSDKSVYGVSELIKIRGIVRDESGSFVLNSLVNASIDNTDIRGSAYTDSNGVFNIEFFSPEQEGVYTISLEAGKAPYIKSNKTLDVQVSKARSISLVVPATIRVKPGDSLTLQFSVVNTGQSDVSGLSIYLVGLPNDYFFLPDKITELEVGQEVKIPVDFNIPKNASESTSSLVFRINSSEVSKEAIIGFTIINENETVASNQTSVFPTFTLPTAFFSLPLSFSDIAWALVFGFMVISGAYLMKRRRVGGVSERKKVNNLLSDIKGEIKRKKSVNPVQSFNQLVEGIEKKEKDN